MGQLGAVLSVFLTPEPGPEVVALSGTVQMAAAKEKEKMVNHILAFKRFQPNVSGQPCCRMNSLEQICLLGQMSYV